MKKKLLILLLLFFITGCKVNYKLDITKDLKVKEELSPSETIEYFDKEYEYYEREDAIDALYRVFKDRISVKYDYVHNKNETGIIATHDYKSLKNYLKENNLYKQFFENIDYIEKGSIITIKSTGDFYKYTCQDNTKFIIEDFELQIKIPFKVIENNADEVKGNTYIWRINSKTEDKKIVLKFDSSILNANKYDLLIIISLVVIIVLAVLFVRYKVKSSN